MLRFVGMPLSGESFTVCLIDFEPEKGAARDGALIECAALDIIKSEAKTDAAAFERNRGGAALIYCARTKYKDKERAFVAALIELIRAELYEQLDLATTAAIGEPVDALCQLNRSYLSAHQALRSRATLGATQTYDAFDRREERGSTPSISPRSCSPGSSRAPRRSLRRASSGFLKRCARRASCPSKTCACSPLTF